MHGLRESTGKNSSVFYPFGKAHMNQNDADYRGPGVGRSFAERLLLSIIDAHPTGGQIASPLSAARDRERRLQTAMQALFGEAKTGRKPDSDDAILRWMGNERSQDLALRDMQGLGFYGQLPARKVRSDRTLAEEAETRFALATGSWERLRSKFGKQVEFWLEIARSHDDIAELMDTWLLDEIRAMLSKRDIASAPNWPDGLPRDHELENKSEAVAARRKLIAALYNAVARIQAERARSD
jgi:hypothetical protein